VGIGLRHVADGLVMMQDDEEDDDEDDDEEDEENGILGLGDSDDDSSDDEEESEDEAALAQVQALLVCCSARHSLHPNLHEGISSVLFCCIEVMGFVQTFCNYARPYKPSHSVIIFLW